MTDATMMKIAGNKADDVKAYMADGFINTDTGLPFTVDELIELRDEVYAEELASLQEEA